MSGHMHDMGVYPNAAFYGHTGRSDMRLNVRVRHGCLSLRVPDGVGVNISNYPGSYARDHVGSINIVNAMSN